MQSFSSFTSRYSMSPSLRKSVNVRQLSSTCWMWSAVTRGKPLRTMMRGRHTRPPSHEMCTVWCLRLVWIETNSPSRPARRIVRISATNRVGLRWTPRIRPLRNTRYSSPPCVTSSPESMVMSSTPSEKQRRSIGASSSSVVTCVISARFLTRPHDSPSGVSAGQSIPHWEGCSERGPDTLRVFSNWDWTRVIMPSAEMNESREST
mmetsp:Transcript_55787/g.132416  ORF Transcript_55787/g.132416 Transcript_55787/m.132416 type:complete len:206 (-) Transcript_55787:1386-2003(-)